jgi:alcohol dehydrogenase class IV
MRFEFATAARIIFGAGTINEVPAEAVKFGKYIFLVTGASSGRAAPLVEGLVAEGCTVTSFPVPGEPSVELVADATEKARSAGCDVVIGVGGGAALDAAKAIAALLGNGGDPMDYIEVVGRGKLISKPSAPFIAIPTTSGTGSEVTRNAVLTASEHHLKSSIRSPYMLPTLAVVDPVLTHSSPPSVTAASGLDALTQLIEPYTGAKPNPIADALCLEGISRAARSVQRAYHTPDDAPAREDMAQASLLSGLALANSGLGAVHGFAMPVGGKFGAPHGAICARLLPLVMEANLNALRQRQPESAVIERYGEVSRLLCSSRTATVDDGVRWVSAVCADLSIPGLSEFGMTTGDIPEIVASAKAANSMKNNPIALTDGELASIMERAL